MSATTLQPKLAARRKRFWTHSAVHIVLIAGCVVFGFPFYWLLATSVKEQDEMFADPPVWVPRWPARVTASPYFASDQNRLPKAPSGVEAGAWRQAVPGLAKTAAAVLTQRFPRPAGVSAELSPQALQALGVNLLAVTSTRMTPEQAKQLLAGEERQVLADVVSERDAKTVWGKVYRELLLGEATFQDQGFVQYRLAPAQASGKGLTPDRVWKPGGGEAEVGPGAMGKEPAALISYDLKGKSSFSLEAEFKAPAGAQSFRRLTLPLKPDRSWHRVNATIDAGGRHYVSGEPLVLFTDLSQEAAWQIPDAERTGASAFLDYFPIRDAGASTLAPDRVHVTLTVQRAGLWGVAYAKARRNYRDAMNFVPLGTYYRNTLILVILNVLGQMLSCSLVAYAFSRLRWPGREPCFAVLLATMMLPAQVTMIPVFLIYRYLGWYNTLQPLWVGSLFGSAFFIFMLRQFMRTIPKELEEAAKIDGCSYWGIYWRIIMPLIRPALAAVAIFTFMNAWNEFMGPLIYLNDQRLYPLSLGLYQFRIEHAADYGMLMAASALMTIPVVIVFFAAQKQFIQGVQLTGIKG
jgi:multiple sugar transport system permease protein